MKIPEGRPKARPSTSRYKLRGAYAAVGLVAFFSAWGSFAQDRDQLRGQMPESAINDEILRRQNLEQTNSSRGTGRPEAGKATPKGVPTPAYRPISDGAVPDDQAEDAAQSTDRSLFPDTADDDAAALGLSDSAPRATGKAPSTARRRAEEARERRSPPPRRTALSTDRARPSETRSDDPALVEEDTTGGIEPVGTVDSETDDKLDEGAKRAEAIEGLDREREDDPYAPLGLRLGSFNVYSSLEQGLTWTSNVNYSSNAEEALLSETTLRLRGESDWVQHQATFEAYGTLRESVDGPEVDDDEAGFNGALRLDLDHEYRAIGTLRYQIKPESASSPVVIEDAVTRPVRQTVEGTAGIQKSLGKLRLSAVAGLSMDDYGDAKLLSGAVLSQEGRNSTLANLKLRTGYEISPAIVPFLELEIGRRKYDQEVDQAGFQRSSDRLAARGGVELDFSEKLRGEISAGWLQETPDDNRLQPIDGLTADANVTWSPHRGTNVNLFTGTTVEGTTTSGESGSLLYTGRMTIDHQILANLTGTALVGASWRDYVGSDGHDLTLTAEAGLTWWMNRYLGVTGRAKHEEVQSNLEGRDTQTESVFLGLKLQR